MALINHVRKLQKRDEFNNEPTWKKLRWDVDHACITAAWENPWPCFETQVILLELEEIYKEKLAAYLLFKGYNVRYEPERELWTLNWGSLNSWSNFYNEQGKYIPEGKYNMHYYDEFYYWFMSRGAILGEKALEFVKVKNKRKNDEKYYLTEGVIGDISFDEDLTPIQRIEKKHKFVPALSPVSNLVCEEELASTV